MTVRDAGSGKRDTSLLFRVNTILLVTTVAVGLLAIAVSAHVTQTQQRDALLRRAELVATLQADTLSGALWELNQRSAQEVITALRDRDRAIRSITVSEIGRTEPFVQVHANSHDDAATSTVERLIGLSDPKGGTKIVGVLRLVYSLGEAEQAAADALMPVIGLLLASLATAILVISVLTNRLVLRPLGRLTQTSRALGAGDYTARLADSSVEGRNDEIGVLARAFNVMAETVQDHTQRLEARVRERTEALSVSNEKLAEQNRQIMDSINYAQLIQASILPKAADLTAGLSEHFILWRPRDVVSGDFYFCRAVEDGFVIGVADCTGHGVPGAFMTMTASAVLNHVIDGMGASDPAAVLTALDRKVRAALHQDGAPVDFDNGLDMALCHVDPRRGRITFAGARLSLYLADEAGTVEIRGERQSLGYRRGDAGPSLSNRTVALRPGQTFYLCTDGLIEQGGGERGLCFGKRRLLDGIGRVRHLGLSGQKERLEQGLAAHQGDRPQRDDITMLGFRVRAAEEAVSRADAALAEA